MADCGRPSESRGPPSPDYFSPCLRLHGLAVLPPSPSPRAPVSLRPSPGVAQPRGEEGRGTGNTKTGEERRLGGNEQSGGALCKSEPTGDEKGILRKKSGDVNVRRTGGRAKDKVATDIDAQFGVRSYVSGRSKQKQESPAAASWISLVSPHTCRQSWLRREPTRTIGGKRNACHIYSPVKLSRVGRKPGPAQTG